MTPKQKEEDLKFIDDQRNIRVSKFSTTDRVYISKSTAKAAREIKVSTPRTSKIMNEISPMIFSHKRRSVKVKSTFYNCCSSESLSPPEKKRKIESTPYTPKHPIGKYRFKSRINKDTKQKSLFSNPTVAVVLDCDQISSRRATRVVAITACALGKGGQNVIQMLLV